MFSPRDIIPPSRQPCYFSLTPGRTAIPFDNFETPLSSPDYVRPFESPVADPSNPLLAYRPAPVTPASRAPFGMETTSLLQRQTQASHQPSRARPQIKPVQPAVDANGTSPTSPTSSNDSDSLQSMRSTAKSSFTSSLATARCSRCHRTPSMDLTTGQSNMVEYGLNLFYCTRCANIVGFRSRSS